MRTKGFFIVADISYGLMHSVSVLELCLLAFLCLSMNALRLTVRDLSFGIAFGFGLMSSGDFILASWSSRIASAGRPAAVRVRVADSGDVAIWSAYCVLPEPVRKPVLMPAKFDHLPLERDRHCAGPHGNQGGSAAARQQLLPLRCGASCGEGARAEYEGPESET